MSITIAEQKAQLRRTLRARLTALAEEARCGEDDRLFSAFLSCPEVEQARTVFLFYGAGTEPDTARLIPALLEQGKRIALPRMLPGRQMELRQFCPDLPLVMHPFGILEPGTDAPLLTKADIDLTLVPALCYDRRGFRLGMGGGYYDRWLVDYRGVCVGLCRTQLLQQAVPTEPHDRPVDLVVCPDEIIRIK